VLGREIPAHERQEGEKHTLNVTLSEVKDTLLGRLLVAIGKKVATQATQTNEIDLALIDHILYSTPLRLMSSESDMSAPQIEGIVHLLNHEFLQGVTSLFSKEK
jgi:hypothetical protein